MLNASNHYTIRHTLGATAEQAVGTFLQKQGYTILQYNYSIRVGEVDLIVQRQEVIAFVEVKARRMHYFNSSEVVTFAKQKKIIKAARKFCLERTLFNLVYRFDVALVQPIENEFAITYIENAFTQLS